ncbi:dynamin family protein [Bacillus alveayuensis]|uniref:dynamin family protein n=1 Tax=Aeribacillus alveayuensis TaxID=279215 RepID=UPI0005CD3F86|nr:dynamin family protein [Bacillus alveayuensis]
MISTKETLSLQQWLKKLLYIYDEMTKKGDYVNAEKVQQLMKKVKNEEFIIAFCGHFSAGKSSMINELIGEPLLPSSPIPTSANLVKVKSGREYARVYYKTEPPIEYPAPYNYDEIKSYCKDGDAIESIEISHRTDRLPHGVVIMDTPGIDSTDDAHRLATESVLHLSDVIFYTMDYNHVQSELNFQFTKELTDHGKSVYLIVNQIDKHREEELSFADFKQSVIQAFRDWNVKVEEIFFTSLKQPDLPNNEFNRLFNFLQTLFHEKDERFASGMKIALKQLLRDHLFFLQEQDADEEEQLKARLHDNIQLDNWSERINRIKQEIEAIQKQGKELKRQFTAELNSVLEHAYIMPFETRELARTFLESMQPDFKVGLFFTKAKTAAERENRLRAFYENVKEKVRTNMEWHVRELLVRFLKEHNMEEHDLLQQCQQLTVPFTEELLVRIVKKGAGVTGDYVLTYTGDVANEFKRLYRDEAMRLFEQFILIWQESAEAEMKALQSRLNEEQEQWNIQVRLEELSQLRKQVYEKLVEVIEGDVPRQEHTEERIAQLVAETFVNGTSKQQENTINVKKAEELQTNEEEWEKTAVKVETEKAIADLYHTAALIKDIKGMKPFINELNEKAQRLKNRSFTVALFGAFSAGKSSFANALIGEKVLPVSPNPTTATINKIVPPTADKPHGTVIVQLKTREQIFNDLQMSLRYFHLKAETLEEAFRLSKKALDIESVDAREKPHYSFIKAVVHGYEAIENHLGTKLCVNLDAFGQYVADETKACFVEWIELYYACPLTEQGITLVDTPGADSVNARHTGVAFEYIKNADAVLFVTYYNHAFSKADREFLIQLGRVKDTFSMDKMFFIINAADLAQSHDELADVLAYVKEQLARFGIRKPRLYPLSSRFALEEKTRETGKTNYGILAESGIRRFEADFERFIIDELISLAITGAYAEITRVHKVISEYIAQAQLDLEAKQAKLQKIKQEQAEMKELFKKAAAETELYALEQEITELVHYIKQRIFLRFGDWFKETFNPATLREDVRDVKKALEACLEELLSSIGFDLAQEMRATSLRVEKFIVEQLRERFAKLQTKAAVIHQGITFADLEHYEFTALSFETGLQNIDRSRFKKALSFYKNAKSFFERDEKRWMREELEKQLQEPVSNYLQENKEFLLRVYLEQYVHAVNRLNEHLEQQCVNYFVGLISALTEPMDIERLQFIKTKLADMLRDK